MHSTSDQTFRPDQPKNSAAGKKFGPLQNLLTNANITVIYTQPVPLSKRNEKSKIKGDEVYFFADIFFFFLGKIIFSQRMPHYFDAAPAPSKNFDAAMAPTLLYTKPTFFSLFFCPLGILYSIFKCMRCIWNPAPSRMEYAYIFIAVRSEH
jgi:hypothetical protein